MTRLRSPSVLRRPLVARARVFSRRQNSRPTRGADRASRPARTPPPRVRRAHTRRLPRASSALRAPFPPTTHLPAPTDDPQLEVYRAEIAQGEKEVASLRRQQASYEERVNVIATEWNTLQADVTALAARVTGEVPTRSVAVDAAAPTATDPFLRRLFETAPGATRKRPRDGDDEDGTGADEDDEDEDGAARGVGGLDDDARRAVAALRARA